MKISRTKAVIRAGVVRLFVSVCITSAFSLNTSGAAVGAQRLLGHVPPAAKSLSPLTRLDGSKHLDLAIGLPLRNQAELTNLLHDLYDPASPSYHQFLTPQQFAERFGP